MRASELIKQLQDKMAELGDDPEVRAQSSGCCNHGHDIESVEVGAAQYSNVATRDEIGVIVIRV